MKIIIIHLFSIIYANLIATTGIQRFICRQIQLKNNWFHGHSKSHCASLVTLILITSCLRTTTDKLLLRYIDILRNIILRTFIKINYDLVQISKFIFFNGENWIPFFKIILQPYGKYFLSTIKNWENVFVIAIG